MSYTVLLLPEVADDLEALFEYISLHDAPEKAVYVITKIHELIDGLSELPNRGSHPKELWGAGYRDCREISFKPYRVFYRVIGEAVRIYLVADGRRDIGELLRQRLLR